MSKQVEGTIHSQVPHPLIVHVKPFKCAREFGELAGYHFNLAGDFADIVLIERVALRKNLLQLAQKILHCAEGSNRLTLVGQADNLTDRAILAALLPPINQIDAPRPDVGLGTEDCLLKVG